MTLTETIEKGIENSRSCGKCVHVNVCAVYRAVAPLLNSFETRKPFKPQDLAKICQEFMPIYTTPPMLRRVPAEE